MKEDWYSRSLYRINPNYSDGYSEEIKYLRRIAGSRTNLIMLDCGCGKFSCLREVKRNGLRIGVDICIESIQKNRDIDMRVVSSVEELPFKEGQFDILMSRWIIEHLKFPHKALGEFSRVAKNRAGLILWTSNLNNYIIIVSRITPFWIHKKFDKELPTYYRANAVGRLNKMLQLVGFENIDVTWVGGAFKYFRKISKILYFLDVLGDRMTDFLHLPFLKHNFIVLYKKVEVVEKIP